MRGLLSAAIFCLLSFQSYAQSSNLKKILLQLDTMADGPVRGHFKNNVLAFSGEVASGKMSGQWIFWNGQGVIKSNSLYENGKKEGLEYLYDKQGRTLSESNFSLGLLEGTYIE
jgi:antitoxin component YwqK of YwqJK toxin-antitoxin module